MSSLPQVEPPFFYGCVWVLITAVIMAVMAQLTGRTLPGALDAAILVVAALIPAARALWRQRRGR